MPRQDGGYGWVIVAAFFFAEIIIDGVRFCFGVMFVDLLQEFMAGKGKTALTGSIVTGVMNLLGPVFAAFVDRFGCRTSAALGSLVSAIGLTASYFVTNIFQLYVTYGVMLGVGCGLGYVSGAVSIGRYFVKRRAFAYGIACCGSGIGTFIFTPICRFLLDTFALRGTLMILAGIAFNGTVFGLMYRPFDGLNDHQLNKNKKSSDNGCELKLDKTKIKNDLFGEEIITDSVKGTSNDLVNQITDSNYKDNNNVAVETSLKNIIGAEYILQHNSTKNQNRFNFIGKLFPRVLVTNPQFICLMLSVWLYGIPVFIPFTLLPDHGVTVGCTKTQSSWFISGLGIGGTIGRLGTGWIADRNGVNRLVFLSMVLVVSGVVTVVVPILSSFELLIAYSFIFGLLFGAVFVLQPIVLLDYFGDENMTEIMGLFMFTAGLSTLVGPPLAGWMYDETGSYFVSFIFAGSLCILSGMAALLVKCFKSKKRDVLEVDP